MFEALGINLGQLLTQIVSFTVLLLILVKLLYRPLLKVLDERSARIRESLESAQKAKEEAAATRVQLESQIQEDDRAGARGS